MWEWVSQNIQSKLKNIITQDFGNKYLYSSVKVSTSENQISYIKLCFWSTMLIEYLILVLLILQVEVSFQVLGLLERCKFRILLLFTSLSSSSPFLRDIFKNNFEETEFFSKKISPLICWSSVEVTFVLNTTSTDFIYF